ncbi:MAG: polyamine aminopropyltransferase [Symploca sp. SIO2B6]|nr:polyamine aminopropyltransferase [Symploca sp. SIO2B6]
MPGIKVGSDSWICEYITPWDIYVHGITNILTYKKTAYQEMHIVETGAYGKALVLDGKWQCCTGDEFIYHEALIHPALICHGSPRRVLVLGGGDGAAVREILRWKTVEQVMMVDIDAEVVEACRQHLPEIHQNSFDDPRMQLVIGDALEVLDNTDQKWDIVISDLSDPIEEGPSFQLFTQEFFEKVQRCLAPEGYFVLQAGPVAPVGLTIYSRVVHTLSSVFPHVHPYASYIPTFGEPWGFALCSAQTITSQPDPVAIDKLLQEETIGGLKLLDGIYLLGLLQTPAYVRRAIASETQVYTIQEPPQFFGQGTLGK